MDCNDARLLLTFARPLATELEESEVEALANHLTSCSGCAALERHERHLDEPIARAMRAVPVPPDLRDRLIGRLARERSAWRRRRAVQWAAVAAALLLAVGGAWVKWGPQPVALDLEAVHWGVNSLPDTPAKVEELFASLGVQKMTAPTSFDYLYLAHCTVADFQGKRVPLLEFRRGENTAWVYVLDDRQFDLQALEGQAGQSGGPYFVEWNREPANPRVAYVIIYTSGGLEQFRKTAQAT